jgi:hypothetical protein
MRAGGGGVPGRAVAPRDGAQPTPLTSCYGTHPHAPGPATLQLCRGREAALAKAVQASQACKARGQDASGQWSAPAVVAVPTCRTRVKQWTSMQQVHWPPGRRWRWWLPSCMTCPTWTLPSAGGRGGGRVVSSTGGWVSSMDGRGAAMLGVHVPGRGARPGFATQGAGRSLIRASVDCWRCWQPLGLPDCTRAAGAARSGDSAVPGLPVVANDMDRTSPKAGWLQPFHAREPPAAQAVAPPHACLPAAALQAHLPNRPSRHSSTAPGHGASPYPILLAPPAGLGTAASPRPHARPAGPAWLVPRHSQRPASNAPPAHEHPLRPCPCRPALPCRLAECQECSAEPGLGHLHARAAPTRT